MNAMNSRIASFVPNVSNLAPMLLPEAVAAACVPDSISCWCSTPGQSGMETGCTYYYCGTCYGGSREEGVCWC